MWRVGWREPGRKGGGNAMECDKKGCEAGEKG